MTGDFESSAVIVTGAGSGIGYGICRAFAKAGADVVLNDIDPELAAQAAGRLNQELRASRVHPYALDIADVGAVQSMIGAVADQFGRLDIVVANAGITNFGSLLDFTPEAFDRVTSVNLRGTFFTAQYAAQEMIQRQTRNGRLIFMSSVTGVQPYPNLAVYGMTKAGIRHLARSFALNLGPHGITANAITPGATLTERTLTDDPDYAENWARTNPNGRVGEVDDIVHATLFLASPKARQITGQSIIVDGGWSLTSPIPEDSPNLPEFSSKLK